MSSRSRLVVVHGHVPADELLRGEVARFHGVPVQVIEIARTCPRCGSSDHGRPRVRATDALPRPASVSLSRAGRFSVVAVTDAGPVGVDVEAPGAADFPGFDGVALHPEESLAVTTSSTQVWTRKEALLKACGLGLAVDPATFRLDSDGVAAWASSAPAPGPVWWRDLALPDHVGAVAVLPAAGAAPIDLSVARCGSQL